MSLDPSSTEKYIILNDYIYGPRLQADVAGALRNCIHDHGPITEKLLGSAIKRVVHQIRGTVSNGLGVT